VDDDSTRLDLHPGRRYAQKLPSIVDAAEGEASYHLVPFGSLILDFGTDVGEDGRLPCNRLNEAPAARLLVSLQAMIDEVEGQQLI
jgi:hypothetical protein